LVHHSSFKTILPHGADALTTAQVMRALDLVVSIDSMPAHLAGALGVRTWTLLQKSADWRWMCGRDDNPWYHAFFRQQQAGDWQPVVAQVKRELRQRLLSRKLHLS
jgi:ADP-heptose:LPS heptosyltransferase